MLIFPPTIVHMKEAPFVEAQLLIRKPVAEVFRAFVDPAVTTRFWFTEASGPLEEGSTVTWHWKMYGVSAEVKVTQLVPNKLIATEWAGPAPNVEYHFEALTEDTTYVVIRNFPFTQSGDELLTLVKDNTAGFTSVLDGLKAWLEHGIALNLVRDKFPQRYSDDAKALDEWQRES